MEKQIKLNDTELVYMSFVMLNDLVEEGEYEIIKQSLSLEQASILYHKKDEILKQVEGVDTDILVVDLFKKIIKELNI